MRTRKSKTYLVWIDCEMTGLDPMKDVILEIATIITNYDLEEIDRGPTLAIRHSEKRLQAMNRWNQRTHARSGLLERIRAEGVSTAEAERQTLAFLRKHCYARTAPLCGNSVGHDKRFLVRAMPQLVAFLHYRIVDVSSIKQLVANWYGGRYKPPRKTGEHRAFSDIRNSIDELRYYREHVFVKE